MSPNTINIITNVLAFLLFLVEPLNAYLSSQPFNWTTFLGCIAGAGVAYLTDKSAQSLQSKTDPQ